MTDKEMIQELTDLGDDYITGTLSYDALDQALIRLAGLTGQSAPPPLGSVEVRIAVAVGQSGKMACYLFEDTDSMDEARDDVNRFGTDTVTNEAIITAHIPLRTIPEATATVKAFDPEATI